MAVDLENDNLSSVVRKIAYFKINQDRCARFLRTPYIILQRITANRRNRHPMPLGFIVKKYFVYLRLLHLTHKYQAIHKSTFIFE